MAGNIHQRRTPMGAKIVACLLPLILAQPLLVEAQVALPGVRLPGAPLGNLPLDTQRTLSAVSNALDTRRLEDLRLLQVRDLIRTHRREVEADPNGAPVLRGVVVAFSPSDSALERARAVGFNVARERALDGLDARLVVLQAPRGMSTRRALDRLRSLDPAGAYDFNHLYMDGGVVGTAPADAAAHPDAATHADAAVRVGLVDGGVGTSHA